ARDDAGRPGRGGALRDFAVPGFAGGKAGPAQAAAPPPARAARAPRAPRASRAGATARAARAPAAAGDIATPERGQREDERADHSRTWISYRRFLAFLAGVLSGVTTGRSDPIPTAMISPSEIPRATISLTMTAARFSLSSLL